MIANCRCLIVALLLFLLCATTQSAPVGLQKRETSTPLSTETQNFYCTSVLLKNLVKFMVQVKHSVALPSVHGNGTYDEGNVNLILQQFNFTCRTFTNVMAIKHQLQHSIFNGTYYNEKNGDLVKVDNNEEMRSFTLILEYLQSLQNILQRIEKILANKYCIEFSASQYEKIYWNLISGSNVSVLNILQSVKWAIIGEYPDDWTKAPNKPPVHSNCINS